jgi:hypothetical protein
MYCPKCGTLNSDQERLCCVCSWLLRSDGYSTVTPNKEMALSFGEDFVGGIDRVLCKNFIIWYNREI